MNKLNRYLLRRILRSVNNRRKSFEEFITGCHGDCVNRVKTNGPDKEI